MDWKFYLLALLFIAMVVSFWAWLFGWFDDDSTRSRCRDTDDLPDVEPGERSGIFSGGSDDAAAGSDSHSCSEGE
jgi:hypothetical protein